jgi:hypothetical protein
MTRRDWARKYAAHLAPCLFTISANLLSILLLLCSSCLASVPAHRCFPIAACWWEACRWCQQPLHGQTMLRVLPLRACPTPDFWSTWTWAE